MTAPTLAWLCSELGRPRTGLSGDLPLGPISIDTRTIRPGDTFWALPGGRDAHAFVADAFAKGAKAAVVEANWAATEAAKPLLDRLIITPDTRAALTRAARVWRAGWSFPVLGITGSNGKTSTKDIILRLLSLKLKTAGTHGNFNNEIGVPLTLLATPADAQVAVVEMGASHAGDIAYLCNIARPTHGLVTSIGRAHLEGFGSLETVAQTKGELYDFIAVGGLAFVPTSDSLCIAESEHCRNRIGYAFQSAPRNWNGEFLEGTDLTYDDLGYAHFRAQGIPFTLGIPGWPAALSALAALAVASHFDVPLDACRDSVKYWSGVHGRVEILRLRDIVLMDDSYNANPTSMRAALETLSHLKGRRVAILGDMNELGGYSDAEHRSLGRDLGRYGVALGLFTGSHASLAAAGAQEAGVPARAYDGYEALEPELKQLILKGDAVLVKGSRSMRLERVAQELKAIFG